MKHDYTYASARIQALASLLLSQSQVELLVGAKDNDELYVVLYDTYLAPYLKRNTEHDILDSLEEHISDTKEMLVSIAPDPKVLDMLWVKYDYHNLKTILKGMRAGLSEEAILRDCYVQSIVNPAVLYSYCTSGTLGKHVPEFAHTFATAQKAKVPEQIGQACDLGYFTHIQSIARESGDEFAETYVRMLIDMYNLKVLARGVLHEAFRVRHAVVPGGTHTLFENFDEAQLARRYAQYGGIEYWKKVLASVREQKSTSILEKRADDAVTEWVKYAGLAEFCLADIVRYFHAVKNNAQIISTIVKATRAEMPEKMLRGILRSLYV
jgi:V/A-type H+/Na+-transporting ATPase subunit C